MLIPTEARIIRQHLRPSDLADEIDPTKVYWRISPEGLHRIREATARSHNFSQ